jgi:hypothetical protein
MAQNACSQELAAGDTRVQFPSLTSFVNLRLPSQEGAAKYLDPALNELKARARGDAYGVLAGLDPLVKAGAHDEAAITEASRAAAEGAPTGGFDPDLVAAVRPLAGDIRSIGARQIAEARAAGAPIQDLADKYTGYVHRQALDVNHNALQLGMGDRAGLFPVTSGANFHRNELLRDIPGGTNRINDWWRRFAGEKDQAAIARAIKKDMVGDLADIGGKIDKATGKAFDDKAKALAERLAVANPRYKEEGLPLFTPDLAADMRQRGAQHARTVASARAAIGTLADAARRASPGDGLVPLPEALKRIGLKTYKDAKAGAPIEGALVEMMRALAKKGARPVDALVGGKVKDLRKQVAGWGVHPEHLDQVVKAYQKWAAPEPLKSPLRALDSFTNAFKALAYPIWIPSHVRNAGTAATSNLRSGVGLGDYLTQLRIMTGKATPEQLTRYGFSNIDEARKAMYASGNIFGGHGVADDVADSALDALRTGEGRFTPHTPGSDRAGPTGNLARDTADLVLRQGLLGSLTSTGKALRDSTLGLFSKGRSWGQGFGEHLGIKGVGGLARDVNPAVKAGRTAGTNIEDFFRGAQWLREVRGGASHAQAAEAVHKLHFDYDALTDFEKNVMRRLVPFYTFARKNLPLQLETALTQPGIINAQYRPFRQDQGGGYVPQYLASGVAIPTGPENDGKRQYISKLGLPAEEAFERLHFKNGLPDLRATALDYMGQLNPLIKAPLEQLFDAQFHSQRRLSDLHAPAAASALGRLFGEDNPQLLSQVLVNTPATRFLTSADKLLDDRKGLGAKALNLLTGVRVTDVDTDKARAVDLRNALDEILRGHPHLSRYSSFYVKPEDAAELTPEEVGLMRLYTELQDRAKQYAQEKRRRVGVGR